jgi:hypothetical protein
VGANILAMIKNIKFSSLYRSIRPQSKALSSSKLYLRVISVA